MAFPGRKDLPNLLTITRILGSAAVFFILAAAATAPPEARAALILWAAGVFAAAAMTDFLDGWLARRLQATSLWGAILDPVADKIAIASALCGLLLLDPSLRIALPGALILFREMFVSGLREGLAPLRLRIPVSRLAKWKTTVQLIALVLEMLRLNAPAAGAFAWTADALWAAAAAITLVTGAQYALGARKALAQR